MRVRAPRGDRSAPQLQQTTPADNATDVPVAANLILTFNEAVKAGTGNIEIRDANGSLVQSIAVTDTSKVTFAGNQLTINPGSDLSPDTSYYVTFGSGVVRDLANNPFAGISSAAVFSFTTEEDYVDTTAPVILFTSPEGYVTGARNVVITFNEPVRAGTGQIEIRNAADDSVYLTISVNDPTQVSFSGRTVIINPTADLPAGNYYVAIAPSAFEDLYGNDTNGAVSAAVEALGVVALASSATATGYGASASAINQGAFASASAASASAYAVGIVQFASSTISVQATATAISQTATDPGHLIAGNDIGIDMTGWNYDAALNGTLVAVSSKQIDILGTDGLTYRLFATGFNTAATTLADVGGAGIWLVETWAGSGADAHILHAEYNNFGPLETMGAPGFPDVTDSKIIGSSDDDVLLGLGGDDLIIGRDGDDVLHGSGGDDRLIGGLGTDTLNGGADTDDFVFVTLEDLNGDTVEDFGAGDTIDLSAIDGLQFSGSFPPTPVAGQVRYAWNGGNTYVLVDSNGDALTDAALKLSGAQFILAETQPGSNVLVMTGIAPPLGLVLTGDAFRNTIAGSNSQDVITGGGQGDTLTGAAGPDRFVYNAVLDSTGKTYDTITDFNGLGDVLDLWFQVTGVDASITGGSLGSRRFDSDLASAVNATKLAAHHAVLYTPNSGAPAGSKFLIVDANGVAGYQAGADLVILLGANLTNLGSLTVSDFV